MGDLRDGLYDVDDSGAFGINNLGEVVGWSEMGEPSLPGHAFLYTPDLGMRDLSELTDGKPADLERFFPHRINVGGDICGPKFDGNYGPILQYRAYVLIRVAND